MWTRETQSQYVRALLVALGLTGLAGLASLGGNRLILSRFPDRPRPQDLLFELLPFVSPVRYLSAAALAIAFALFVYYAVRYTPLRIPEYATIFALMYLLRAGLMVLTPLASAQGEGAFVFSVQQYGMFPSGHTAAAVLLWRLTARRPLPALRRAQAVMALCVAASLLLAHGHYSVDIAGGFLVAYFVQEEWHQGRLFNPLKRLTRVERC